MIPYAKFLLPALCLLTMCSCNKDNEEPLSLMYVENNTLSLTYPSLVGGSYTIVGGDGQYSFECASPLVEIEQTYPNVIQINKVLGIGDAQLIIRDHSGHTCPVAIHIGYNNYGFTVIRHEVAISGEGLTDPQKAEIEADAMRSFPVAVGGSYRFTPMEFLNPDGSAVSGEAEVGNAVCAFENEWVTRGEAQWREYRIMIGGNERTFILTAYQPQQALSRSLQRETACLTEDLTAHYRAGYPQVASVYAMQVIQ